MQIGYSNANWLFKVLLLMLLMLFGIVETRAGSKIILFVRRLPSILSFKKFLSRDDTNIVISELSMIPRVYINWIFSCPWENLEVINGGRTIFEWL